VFQPEDIIAKKHSRSKQSGASSGKTFIGMNPNTQQPLEAIKSFGSKRNKRQVSEAQILKIMEIRNKIHRRHFSASDPLHNKLSESQMKMLENLKDSELLKEISEFMDPKEIINMFSVSHVHTPGTDPNEGNLIQFSTLSTDPKNKGKCNGKGNE